MGKFLRCLEHNKDSSTDTGLISEDLVVLVEDASCTWSSNVEEEHSLTIKHVSLSVPKGSFVAIIGEVQKLSPLSLFYLSLSIYYHSSYVCFLSFFRLVQVKHHC